MLEILENQDELGVIHTSDSKRVSSKELGFFERNPQLHCNHARHPPHYINSDDLLGTLANCSIHHRDQFPEESAGTVGRSEACDVSLDHVHGNAVRNCKSGGAHWTHLLAALDSRNNETVSSSVHGEVFELKISSFTTAETTIHCNDHYGLCQQNLGGIHLVEKLLELSGGKVLYNDVLSLKFSRKIVNLQIYL